MRPVCNAAIGPAMIVVLPRPLDCRNQLPVLLSRLRSCTTSTTTKRWTYIPLAWSSWSSPFSSSPIMSAKTRLKSTERWDGLSDITFLTYILFDCYSYSSRLPLLRLRDVCSRLPCCDFVRKSRCRRRLCIIRPGVCLSAVYYAQFLIATVFPTELLPLLAGDIPDPAAGFDQGLQP